MDAVSFLAVAKVNGSTVHSMKQSASCASATTVRSSRGKTSVYHVYSELGTDGFELACTP